MATLIKEQVSACVIVARYGGEEYVVALPTTTPPVAYEIAERLRQAICLTPLSFHDKQFKVSISIGMANLRSLSIAQSHDIELICTTLLDRADKALYTAKAGGRNQVAVHTNSATQWIG